MLLNNEIMKYFGGETVKFKNETNLKKLWVVEKCHENRVTGNEYDLRSLYSNDKYQYERIYKIPESFLTQVI